jgi:hypothetical protein
MLSTPQVLQSERIFPNGHFTTRLLGFQAIPDDYRPTIGNFSPSIHNDTVTLSDMVVSIATTFHMIVMMKQSLLKPQSGSSG